MLDRAATDSSVAGAGSRAVRTSRRKRTPDKPAVVNDSDDEKSEGKSGAAAKRHRKAAPSKDKPPADDSDKGVTAKKPRKKKTTAERLAKPRDSKIVPETESTAAKEETASAESDEGIDLAADATKDVVTADGFDTKKQARGIFHAQFLKSFHEIVKNQAKYGVDPIYGSLPPAVFGPICAKETCARGGALSLYMAARDKIGKPNRRDVLWVALSERLDDTDKAGLSEQEIDERVDQLWTRDRISKLRRIYEIGLEAAREAREKAVEEATRRSPLAEARVVSPEPPHVPIPRKYGDIKQLPLSLLTQVTAGQLLEEWPGREVYDHLEMLTDNIPAARDLKRTPEDAQKQLNLIKKHQKKVAASFVPDDIEENKDKEVEAEEEETELNPAFTQQPTSRYVFPASLKKHKEPPTVEPTSATHKQRKDKPAGRHGFKNYWFCSAPVRKEMDAIAASEDADLAYRKWVETPEDEREQNQLSVDPTWEKVEALNKIDRELARKSLQHHARAHEKEYSDMHNKPVIRDTREPGERRKPGHRVDAATLAAVQDADSRAQNLDFSTLLTRANQEFKDLKADGAWSTTQTQVEASRRAVQALMDQRGISARKSTKAEREAAEILSKVDIVGARGSTPYAAELMRRMKTSPGIELTRVLGYLQSVPDGGYATAPTPPVRKKLATMAAASASPMEGDDEAEEGEDEEDGEADSEEEDAMADAEDLEANSSESDFEAGKADNEAGAAGYQNEPGSDFVAPETKFVQQWDTRGRPLGRQRVLSPAEMATQERQKQARKRKTPMNAAAIELQRRGQEDTVDLTMDQADDDPIYQEFTALAQKWHRDHGGQTSSSSNKPGGGTAPTKRRRKSRKDSDTVTGSLFARAVGCEVGSEEELSVEERKEVSGTDYKPLFNHASFTSKDREFICCPETGITLRYSVDAQIVTHRSSWPESTYGQVQGPLTHILRFWQNNADAVPNLYLVQGHSPRSRHWQSELAGELRKAAEWLETQAVGEQTDFWELTEEIGEAHHRSALEAKRAEDSDVVALKHVRVRGATITVDTVRGKEQRPTLSSSSNGKGVQVQCAPWGTGDVKTAKEHLREFKEFADLGGLKPKLWVAAFRQTLMERHVKMVVDSVPFWLEEPAEEHFNRVARTFSKAFGQTAIAQRGLEEALQLRRKGVNEPIQNYVNAFFQCVALLQNEEATTDLTQEHFRTLLRNAGANLKRHALNWEYAPHRALMYNGDPPPNVIPNRSTLIAKMQQWSDNRSAPERLEDFIHGMMDHERHGGATMGDTGFSMDGVRNGSNGKIEHLGLGTTQNDCFRTPAPNDFAKKEWQSLKHRQDLTIYGYDNASTYGKPLPGAKSAAARPQAQQQQGKGRQNPKAKQQQQKRKVEAQQRAAAAAPQQTSAEPDAKRQRPNSSKKKGNKESAKAAAEAAAARAANRTFGPCSNCGLRRHDWAHCSRNPDNPRHQPAALHFKDMGGHPKATVEDCESVGITPHPDAPRNKDVNEDGSPKDKEEDGEDGAEASDEASVHRVRITGQRLRRVARIRLGQHGTAEVLIPGQFKGLPRRQCLIDSGAQISMLNGKYYDQHKSTLGPLARTRFAIRVADGSRAHTRGQVTVEFTAHDEFTGRSSTVVHDFIVVDGMDTVAIIGMDISQRLFHSMTFEEGRLHFKPASAMVRVVQEAAPSVPLLVRTTCMVEGRTCRLIPVVFASGSSLPENATVMVEPGTIRGRNGELMHLDFVPHIRMATDPEHPQPYMIALRNEDIRRLRIEAGCVIGRAHLVVDGDVRGLSEQRPADRLPEARTGTAVTCTLPSDLTDRIRIRVRAVGVVEQVDQDGNLEMKDAAAGAHLEPASRA